MPTPLSISWDGGLIFLSYCLAVQAAYTAIHILQLRVSRLLYVVAALCLGVSGIWSMHFIGMAAMSIDANVKFDLGWTIGSAFFAFVPCVAGLALAGEKVNPEPVTDNGIKANLKALLGAPHHWMVLAGSLIALGVCCMHYTGMHAMSSEALPTLDWGVIIGSCFIALFAATAALYFALVLPLTRTFTVPTSLIAGVAVCGMHYTGMYGISYAVPDGVTVVGKSNSLQPTVPYIILGSWVFSFSSLALATHLYRENLKAAEERSQNGVAFAKEMTHLISGYDMNGAAELVAESAEVDIDENLRNQFELMLERLEPYRAYLPQSLFAKGSDEEDEDTENESISSSHMSASGTSARLSSKGTERSRASSVLSVSQTGAQVKNISVSVKPVSILVVNCRDFHDTLCRQGVSATTTMQTTLINICTKSAQSSKGVIDAFQGDHLVISFNASNNVAAHQRRAAATADTIRDELVKANFPLGVTMGLASGDGLVGPMGTNDLRRFCVVGSVVPEAFALERLCKRYAGASILMQRRMALELGADFQHEAVDVLPGGFFSSKIARTATPKAPVIVSALHKHLAAKEDEWMYQLEACQKSDPYKNINEAFCALLPKDDKVELANVEKLRDEIGETNEASLKRFDNVVARTTLTGTPQAELGEFFSLL